MNIQEFIDKINLSKQGKLDLSSDEDLSIALMNLISIEEHFFFTAEKTGKDEYLDLLAQVREIRKDLLKKIIKQYEGEVWCISKHLLASSMRLMEVGTKQMGMGNKEEAKDLFHKAYDLYSLFWALNLGAIKTDGVRKIAEESLSATEEMGFKDREFSEMKIEIDTKNGDVRRGGFSKFGDIIKKLVDCCIE